MLRSLALAFSILILPAITPAEECARDTGAAAAAARDCGEPAPPPLPVADTALDATSDSAHRSDPPPATLRAPTRVGPLGAWTISGAHGDALALRSREHVAYDATAPPLG